MQTKEVFEIALAIIGSVGGSAVIIAGLSSWLGKVWANRIMQSEIAKHNEELSIIKSNLTKVENEHQIRFTNVHEKQASAISELYSLLYEVNSGRDRMLMQLTCRNIREEADREFNNCEEWEYIYGIHTLTDEEKVLTENLKNAIAALYDFYGKNRLYLSLRCCELMDRVAGLSSFISGNYSNVAIKDSKGNLMVHPDVKKAWDSSVEAIPQLLPHLEQEFRAHLGINQHGLTSGSR